jgi:hypothetical protein
MSDTGVRLCDYCGPRKWQCPPYLKEIGRGDHILTLTAPDGKATTLHLCSACMSAVSFYSSRIMSNLHLFRENYATTEASDSPCTLRGCAIGYPHKQHD